MQGMIRTIPESSVMSYKAFPTREQVLLAEDASKLLGWTVSVTRGDDGLNHNYDSLRIDTFYIYKDDEENNYTVYQLKVTPASWEEPETINEEYVNDFPNFPKALSFVINALFQDGLFASLENAFDALNPYT